MYFWYELTPKKKAYNFKCSLNFFIIQYLYDPVPVWLNIYMIQYLHG